MSYGERLQFSYNQNGGAAVHQAWQYVTAEDMIFWEGAKRSQFRDVWVKLTPHHKALVQQTLTQAGLGQKMTSALNKVSDKMGETYLVQMWPAITPNQQFGVTKASYVNARGLFVIQDIKIKIANTPIFEIEGIFMFILMALMGKLEMWAPLIGYCKTVDQLIEDSRVTRILYAPFFGLPFQDGPQGTYPNGSIGLHNLNCEIRTQPNYAVVVNWDGVSATANTALPIELDSGNAFGNQSVQFLLASNLYWLGAQEKLALAHGYNEGLFREAINVQSFNINASAAPHQEKLRVTISGPCTHIIVIIQSQTDMNNKNWTKWNNDNGYDYITEFMLLLNNTPREDPMPASWYRTIKPIECFKHRPRHCIYVFPFELDSTVRQPTGHQTLTNFAAIDIGMFFREHADALIVTIYVRVWNAWYTDDGSGGRIWG